MNEDHLGPDFWACMWCKQPFPNVREWGRHQNRHVEEKIEEGMKEWARRFPYQCKVCTVRFKTRPKLAAHSCRFKFSTNSHAPR